MMPNVVRGDRMAGLLTYLTGPGRANEHTELAIEGFDPADGFRRGNEPVKRRDFFCCWFDNADDR